MKNNKPNKIEDVYPLTIICMKHGKFAIVESHANSYCVNSLENDEEVQYDPNTFMYNEWDYINYGIGSDINSAFDDFLKRFK